MKKLLPLLLCVAALPVQAQTYKAPTGNCDAAVMFLEAARVAHTTADTALRQARVCTPDANKAMDAKLAAAGNISRRADGVLAACPGMDDAMVQGQKMTVFGQTAVADATRQRQDMTASCTR